MTYFILLNILVTLTLSSGTIIPCAEVKNSTWTIDNLKNVQLKDWRWDCLNSRYPNATFDDAFSKLNISVNDAAGRGYIGFVQYYAEKKKADLTARNRDGNTPLHLAVQNKHEQVIKYIASKVNKPRELNKHNYDHNTPLMLAAYTCQKDIVNFFIKTMKLNTYITEAEKAELLNETMKGGCYPVLHYLTEDERYWLDRDSVNYLLSAAIGGNTAVLEHLIHKDLVRTGVDRDGNSALHVAALHGKIDAVEFFMHNLEYNPDLKNKKGERPSHLAVKGGSLPVLEYLIDDMRADLKAVNSNGETLLHYAAEYGHLPIVEYLVDEKKVNVDEQDQASLVTPVRRAIRANKFPVVKYLVEEKHADLKLEDLLNRTAVHEAAQSGNVDLMKYLLDDKKLINELNATDKQSKTPARDAVELGHLDMLKYLVDERHADISGNDSSGENILQTAVKFNRLPIVKYLIEYKYFYPNEPMIKLTKDRQLWEYLRTKG